MASLLSLLVTLSVQIQLSTELCTRLLTLTIRDQTVTEETGSHLMAYHATVRMLTTSHPSHSHAQQVAAPVGVSVLLWVLPWVASLAVSC